MNNELWLAKPVPRYTSYPPAPAFHGGITAGEYAKIISGLSDDEAVSLYIHIPFCRSLCLYCGCHTSVTLKDDRIESYLDAVVREMDLISKTIKRKQRISHLHFGGGTPNSLSKNAMTGIFRALRDFFDISACAEIAMELDPRLITREQAEVMAKCGVTRVSLGVQDVNPKVQDVVNRTQPYEMISQACDMLRDVGIRKINFDLMYGLPLQTPGSVSDSVRQAICLSPDRVAFFSYAHVPQIKKHQVALEQYGLPDKFALIEQERAGRQVLLDAGYIAIGMDHFAKPEDSLAISMKERRLRRNFQGYTDDAAKTLLGIGASSIGFASGAFFQNERDVEIYQSILQSGKFATMRGIKLTNDDCARAAIIEALMCYMECDAGSGSFDAEIKALKPFVDAGIIEITDNKISLAIPDRVAIRVICSIFDRYLGAGAVSSKAV
ncbi:MAG: oxygen-independent coproporphyrinogen III oxidase [Alphaproteobacteria bacterium]|nr:oxygen-independent coproporphyrinogen III oxidase [Alphaproteobacteria bacterium]